MKKRKTLALIMTVSLIGTALVGTNANATEVGNKTNETKSVVQPRAQYGVITGSNVRLRSAPGLSSTVYAQLQSGYRVTMPSVNEVYKDGYWWTYVVYNNIYGWVASNYVEMI